MLVALDRCVVLKSWVGAVWWRWGLCLRLSVRFREVIHGHRSQTNKGNISGLKWSLWGPPSTGLSLCSAVQKWQTRLLFPDLQRLLHLLTYSPVLRLFRDQNRPAACVQRSRRRSPWMPRWNPARLPGNKPQALSPSSRRIRPSPEPPSASRTLEHSPTVYTSEEREHLLCPGANKQPKNRSMQSSTSDPHSAAFLQTTAKSFTWGGHLPAYLSWYMHTEPWLPAKPPQDSTSSCHSLHLPSCSSSSSFSIRLFLGCDPTRHEELHYPSSLPTIHMGSSCPSSSAHSQRLVKANIFQSSTFSSICCCRSWKNPKNLLPSLQSDPESIFVVLFQLQRWLWRRSFIFHFLSELWHFWTSWVKIKRVELMQTQQFQVICKLQLSSKPPGGSKPKTRHLFSTKIRLSVLNWQWFCFILTIRSSQVFSSQNNKNNHQTRTFEFTDFWPSYSHKLLVVFLFHETGASEVSFYFESLYCSTWGLFLSLILLQWMLEVYHYFSDQELLDYW